MIKSQLTTDKLAMSLSTICVLHCFLTPSFLILTSGIFALTIDNEFVHGLILFLAVPISLLALLMGYKNHQTSAFFAIGCLGLLVLLVTFLLLLVVESSHSSVMLQIILLGLTRKLSFLPSLFWSTQSRLC